MEGHPEVLVLGILLESFLAVPGGVLEGEEGSVGGEEEVETADSDDGVVGVLDDALENVVLSGREGGVAAVGLGVAEAKDVIGRALIPCHVGGGIEGLLDICAVEVDLGTGRRIIALDLLALAFGSEEMSLPG